MYLEGCCGAVEPRLNVSIGFTDVLSRDATGKDARGGALLELGEWRPATGGGGVAWIRRGGEEVDVRT